MVSNLTNILLGSKFLPLIRFGLNLILYDSDLAQNSINLLPLKILFNDFINGYLALRSGSWSRGFGWFY